MVFSRHPGALLPLRHCEVHAVLTPTIQRYRALGPLLGGIGCDIRFAGGFSGSWLVHVIYLHENWSLFFSRGAPMRRARETIHTGARCVLERFLFILSHLNPSSLPNFGATTNWVLNLYSAIPRGAPSAPLRHAGGASLLPRSSSLRSSSRSHPSNVNQVRWVRSHDISSTWRSHQLRRHTVALRFISARCVLLPLHFPAQVFMHSIDFPLFTCATRSST
jgi:hypothetical protein